MTSTPEKSAEQRRLDQRSPTARQSRQREIEHRAQDCGGKGSRGAKCISTWLECSSSLGSFARAGDRGDGAQDLRPLRGRRDLEWARRIAEAQFDLNRVRNSRRLLITQFLVDPDFLPRHSPQTAASGLASGSRAVTVPGRCLSKSIRSRTYLAPCLPKARKSLRSS